MRRLLQLPSPSSGGGKSPSTTPAHIAAAREMEQAIGNYMRRAAEMFDLAKSTEVLTTTLRQQVIWWNFACHLHKLLFLSAADFKLFVLKDG